MNGLKIRYENVYKTFLLDTKKIRNKKNADIGLIWYVLYMYTKTLCYSQMYCIGEK